MELSHRSSTCQQKLENIIPIYTQGVVTPLINYFLAYAMPRTERGDL
jgi:hypothetical protein